MGDQVTFSFGENWEKYLDTMPAEAIERMAAYVDDWVGAYLPGARVLDIGSGQGLTSLCAFRAGANVTSFDADPKSVHATRQLWQRAGSPGNWAVMSGSILDPEFMASLGTYDLVISWGVLHHTGHMWNAIEAASSLVTQPGHLWIALYHKTRRSGLSRLTKRAYNRTPGALKPTFRGAYALAKVANMLVRERSTKRIREYGTERGMSWWRDIEDWLGGLPYEVADPEHVVRALATFQLDRISRAKGEGGNDVYLFSRAGQST